MTMRMIRIPVIVMVVVTDVDYDRDYDGEFWKECLARQVIELTHSHETASAVLGIKTNAKLSGCTTRLYLTRVG